MRFKTLTTITAVLFILFGLSFAFDDFSLFRVFGPNLRLPRRLVLESSANRMEFRVVGVAANSEELLARLDDWLPEVVVMDLLMPGGMDGIAGTRQVRRRWPRTQVMALTASTDDARLFGALRAGAVGYVRKDAEPDLLLAAVRAAARGQVMIDPAVAAVLPEALGWSTP